jgi:glycosyltransferase involved in cell wall biosynthesis
MFALIKRWRLEAEDWLRYSPRVRSAICRYKLWRTRELDSGDAQAQARTVVQLCAAARLADGEDRERRIQASIADVLDGLDPARIEWKEFCPDFDDPRVHKAAILKRCVGPREKGVLFISFEGQWIKLLRPANYRELAERYTIVIAPSSSPHNLINYVFPRAYPDPVFTLISNPHDQEVLPWVSDRLIVVPLYASHWVNPGLYQPLPKHERPFDLIMVASWGKVKRHQALFAALRSLPRNLRVLLVGQEQEGRSADTICELARWYGVHDRFTILTNQTYEAVTKLFCQARSSVVLSKREGSCVVVAESMFADTPVAILRGAELGSRVFINDQTGRFLDGRRLPRDLADFIANADRCQPRAWAEANISCFLSTQRLNDVLKQAALATSQEWTEDIAAMQWSPDPRLVRPEDRSRLARERADILARFGLEMGPAPVQ